MTQEDKELLLRDLCTRLPYKIKIKIAFNKDIEKINNLIYVSDNEPSYIHNSCMVLTEDNIKYVFNDWFDEYKPYLRSMSSMTDEEENEYRAINCYEGLFPCNEDALDYVLSNHFDYRGLIEKGLAIEVTKENNPYKD